MAGLLPTSATVVDVGSGPGYDAVELLRLAPPGRVARWILVDPQREMLAQSRSTVLTELSRTGLAGLMVADAAALPIANETVDVVLSLGVLCCMSDASVGPAIDETSRVLRPGGWVVFGVPRRRGDTDLPRWREAGLEMAERVRPGAGLLRKRI